MKKLILILCSLLFLTSSFTEVIHPYHVGSVEFKYNVTSKTFEITGRFFLDDLETALQEKYGTMLRFQDEKYKANMDEVLKKYCAEYLRLKTDSQFVNVNYVGYEEDRESVNIYLESDKIKAPKKVETAVSFLYNYYDDQINLVHIIVNGNRKSTKLTYPDRYSFQTF
ncbi:DUF6702 family protein [uncultured Chryseobacterium sp.]|uniref:DUF6702 family protein n=1 Tax=uncultured Chryseobacterium sp. TaxID=259322 RepID=UPI00260F0873|nr:DUF6702 family protein [uncultured Chryseobacterium sp.]